MSEQVFTVFSEDGFQDNGPCQGEFSDLSLTAMIAVFARLWPDSRLVAWAPNHDVYERGMHVVRDESIAAGRIIEKVGDRWVARGVPEEKPKAQVVQSVTIYESNWGETKAPIAEPKRPALTWNKPSRIDRFEGFVVTSCTEEQGSYSSPLQTLGEMGNPSHGSAKLVKG